MFRLSDLQVSENNLPPYLHTDPTTESSTCMAEKIHPSVSWVRGQPLMVSSLLPCQQTSARVVILGSRDGKRQNCAGLMDLQTRMQRRLAPSEDQY